MEHIMMPQILIDKNKNYIVDYVTGWAVVNYPSNTVFPASVSRILDSIVFIFVCTKTSRGRKHI